MRHGAARITPALPQRIALDGAARTTIAFAHVVSEFERRARLAQRCRIITR
jgi:hypothetical protein